MTGFEPAASCSQSRRATNCATPGYSVYLSGWSYSPKASALPTALHPEIFSFAPTILAQLLTFLPACLARPACGPRKNPRAVRLLDFFDRGACSASLHPPPAALGFAPQSAGATNCATPRYEVRRSGWAYSPKASALPTALHPEIFSFAPTILAQLLTFLPACLARPACGPRKNPRAVRLLDFFDRGACSASLHPPPAALGFAPQSAGATNCAAPPKLYYFLPACFARPACGPR